MEVLYRLSYPGGVLTVAAFGGCERSGVEREALAVHAARGVRAEEGDRLRQVLGGGEGGALGLGVLLAQAGGLDRVDDDDVGGGAGAGEGVGAGEGPGLGGGLGGGVGGVGVLGVLRGGGGDEDEAAVVAPGQGGVEGAAGVLEGADQEVVEELVVGEVEGLDGVAAAVAADKVEETVDLAEALVGGLRPFGGGRRVEEV